MLLRSKWKNRLAGEGKKFQRVRLRNVAPHTAFLHGITGWNCRDLASEEHVVPILAVVLQFVCYARVQTCYCTTCSFLYSLRPFLLGRPMRSFTPLKTLTTFTSSSLRPAASLLSSVPQKRLFTRRPTLHTNIPLHRSMYALTALFCLFLLIK